MKKLSLKKLARAGIIAALYFILSAFLQPISFGTIQFRLGEALAMLPFIMPEAIFGVSIGCLLSNAIFSPFGIYDVIFGTLATILAAVLTFKIRNIWFSALPPIFVNAIILPFIWLFLSGDTAYFINFISIVISQAVIMYLLGIPLVIGLRKAMPNEFLDKAKPRQEKDK